MLDEICRHSQETLLFLAALANTNRAVVHGERVSGGSIPVRTNSPDRAIESCISLSTMEFAFFRGREVQVASSFRALYSCSRHDQRFRSLIRPAWFLQAFSTHRRRKVN